MSDYLSSLGLPELIGLFIVCALVITLVGTRMAILADRLADSLGIGEALMGGLFLGSMTSLPGISASVSAAWNGYPELSVNNALGGLAIQTVFLAIADFAYPRANLEHAATSISNILQGVLLVSLLTIPLISMFSPDYIWLGVHPGSLVLIIAYVVGMLIVSRTRKRPMWHWAQTSETRPDVPDEANLQAGNTKKQGGAFILLAAIIVLAGHAVAKTGIQISAQSGLSEGFVGAVLTGVATSLPELVISIAAVRAGALTLAVGGVLGGNCFDVLFLSFSDVAYRDGSIYHAIGHSEAYLLALTMLLNCIIIMGLIVRQKEGFANIGWESVLVIILYLSGILIIL